MPDIGLSLGAIAVKIACKLWLRDRAIAADAGVELADILKSRIADDWDRRKVQRLFDRLEETAGRRIMSVLGHEFRGIDPHERAAVQWLVHGALERASLTDTDLFAADLDPMFLERQIRRSSPGATRDLGEAATALYKRILAECCTDIIEIVSALPPFGPAAFTEILRRETKLIDMISELLDRVPARDVAERKATADSDFAAGYRRHVVNRLDRLRLFGVTQSTLRYPLTVAYISLNVTSAGRVSDISMQPDTLFGHLDGKTAVAESPVRIEQLLSQSTRLLIRGDAGSGKTTLLQWIAVRSASLNFDDPLSAWSTLVPFFIQLRNYVDRDLPQPAEFVKQIGGHVADDMPHGWVVELLRSGLALVLVDGVDELPAKRRRAARQWLDDLVTDFPGARYVVTSRPAAVDKQWLGSQGFLAADLEPMSHADVTSFIVKWHEAVRRESVDAGESAELARCHAKLQETLARERRLRQLATNPLMCALLCALHRDRQTQLPRDRIEIYDAALDMLLVRRDTERGVAEDIAGLSKRRKMIILQNLAYWLIRNGLSNGPRVRAIQHIESWLLTMPDISAEPEAVLQILLERSGIMREPVSGRIDFGHRTFQEYLAARAIIDDGDLGVLLDHAHDDLWQEVVVLAAGYAGAAAGKEIFDELLRRARQGSGETRTRLHLVALACLETAPQIHVERRREIEAEAASLLPPTTLAQAEAVAKAGDFSLELLIKRPVQSARQTKATIRAASLIGGNEALQLIKKCIQHSTKPSVIAEALRAWSRFEPETYARDILAYLRLNGLEVNNPAQLTALRHLHDLAFLTLRFPDGHGDVSPLANVPRLEYLSISDQLLHDISPLSACGRLSVLELRQTGRVDLGELAGCHGLRGLDFDYESVVDPARVRHLVMLNNLQASSAHSFRQVQGILPPESRLIRFGLWDALEVGDLDDMRNARQLAEIQFLLLGRAYRLDRIAGIEAWSQTITGVYLQAPRLSDYEVIGSLRNLTFANLRSVPIKDLSFALSLPKLAFLHVGGNYPLPDLGPLSALPELSHLYLYSSGEIDLRPLAGKECLTVHVARSQSRAVIGADQLGRGSKLQRF